MLTGKADSLFPSQTRKLLLIFMCMLSFASLTALYCFQGNVTKIAMLCLATLCFMCLLVLYKNSINKYEVGIFCFLCLQLVAVVPIPNNMSPNNSAYFLSYRYGISSRSLIATIIDFFTNGGFISKYFIWSFILCATLFFSFGISVSLGTIIKKAQENIKFFLICLSLLYLSCFTGPSTYFIWSNFGRLEVYALLFVLLSVYIIDKPGLRWFLPLLALLVMAAHTLLVFFYIPLFIIMQLYILISKPGKDKNGIILLIVTIVVIITAFLCYTLFYERTFVFKDANSFFEHISAKTDSNVISAQLFHMFLFGRLQDHLNNWKDTVNLTFSGHFSIIINLPFVIMALIFWLKCLRCETDKKMKFFFLLPMLVLPYQAIAFFMFYDFGRWMTMLLNCQFVIIFYLLHTRNKTALAVAESIIPFLKRNAFSIVLLCLIMTFLGPVRAIGPSSVGITRAGSAIVNFIQMIIQ